MKSVFNPSSDQWEVLTARPTASLDDVMPIVDEVFTDIQSHGDDALRKYSTKFDGYAPKTLEVPLADLQNAANELSGDLKSAIDKAYDNIYAFHLAQQTERVHVSV